MPKQDLSPHARAQDMALPHLHAAPSGAFIERATCHLAYVRGAQPISRADGGRPGPRAGRQRALYVSRAHYVEAGGRGALRPRCAQMRAQTYAACTEAIPRASQGKNLPTPFGPTPKVTPAKGHYYT